MRLSALGLLLMLHGERGGFSVEIKTDSFGFKTRSKGKEKKKTLVRTKKLHFNPFTPSGFISHNSLDLSIYKSRVFGDIYPKRKKVRKEKSKLLDLYTVWLIKMKFFGC